MKGHSTTRARQKTKIKAVAYKGGCCKVCGYTKSLRALHFHHLNSNEKSFTIAHNRYSWAAVKQELDKCVLLCSNCHAELHDGIISL